MQPLCQVLVKYQDLARLDLFDGIGTRQRRCGRAARQRQPGAAWQVRKLSRIIIVARLPISKRLGIAQLSDAGIQVGVLQVKPAA
jgi:hypothetical protein